MAQSGKSAETYYAAAQKLPGAFLRERFAESGLTEDEARDIRIGAQNSRIDELLGQASESVDGRIERGIAQASRRRGERQEKAKAKARTDDTVLAALLADIERMEGSLADQYGRGFAGDLLADLCAKGLVGDDEYTRIMAIEDDTERRRAIAMKIQEGLDNGTIKPEDLKEHPWAHEWLAKHKEATTEMTRQAARYDRGEVGVNALSKSAKYEAGKLAFSEGDTTPNEAESAALESENQTAETSDLRSLATSFDFSAV